MKSSSVRLLYHSVSFMLTVIVLNGCRYHRGKTGEETRNGHAGNTALVKVQYAKRFSVNTLNGYTVVKVNSPFPGSDNHFTYILRDSLNKDPLPGIPDAQIINIPVKTIVCYSTSHLPALEMLGVAGSLTGFPNTDYISSPVFRKMVDEGKVTDLGPSNDINFESLMSLNPAMVMAYSMGNDLNTVNRITRAGIPVVLNADYMEADPLGRAEWIKFTALFFGKSRKADSIFSKIRNNYLADKRRAMHVDYKPTVLTGIVYGDTWFMPGGKSYASAFFHDAGAKYLWADDTASSTLQLSFEAVYARAVNADYWVGTASYNSMKALKNADNRYADFKAFKTGKVYNYSARIGKNGGNDYFETGYARPDIVLEDLVSIFHPGLVKNHKMYFYRKIE